MSKKGFFFIVVLLFSKNINTTDDGYDTPDEMFYREYRFTSKNRNNDIIQKYVDEREIVFLADMLGNYVNISKYSFVNDTQMKMILRHLDTNTNKEKEAGLIAQIGFLMYSNDVEKGMSTYIENLFPIHDECQDPSKIEGLVIQKLVQLLSHMNAKRLTVGDYAYWISGFRVCFVSVSPENMAKILDIITPQIISFFQSIFNDINFWNADPYQQSMILNNMLFVLGVMGRYMETIHVFLKMYNSELVNPDLMTMLMVLKVIPKMPENIQLDLLIFYYYCVKKRNIIYDSEVLFYLQLIDTIREVMKNDPNIISFVYMVFHEYLKSHTNKLENIVVKGFVTIIHEMGMKIHKRDFDDIIV